MPGVCRWTDQTRIPYPCAAREGSDFRTIEWHGGSTVGRGECLRSARTPLDGRQQLPRPLSLVAQVADPGWAAVHVLSILSNSGRFKNGRASQIEGKWSTGSVLAAGNEPPHNAVSLARQMPRRKDW